jgi:acetolactate synthase-1/2/3 large subunit
VVVDIPKDVTDPNIKIPYDYPASRDALLQPGERATWARSQGRGGMLEAKRPVIYTGGGVVLGEASAPLTELVRG